MSLFPRIYLVIFLSTWPFSFAAGQKLDCRPCDDHYGQVKVGTSEQHLLQLKNVGTKSLRIRAKDLNGRSFSFGNFPLPVTIGAGKTVKLPIRFAPSSAGKKTAAITLTSTAKNSRFVIDVEGVGVRNDSAHLTATPATLDFGNVTVGSSSSLPMTLSATGTAVTVTAVESDSSEFTLPGLSLPLSIGVGNNVPVTIKFTPNASGRATGKLRIASNADNSPVTASTTGVGVAAGSHSADLTWNPSNDVVVGYNVYRGTAKGGPYSQINGALDATTSYTDHAVESGNTYYYVATAVNAESQESGPSNEVKVVIPTP